MKTRLTTTKANGKAPICSACKYLLRQHLITFMTGKILRYLSSKYVREMRMRLLFIYSLEIFRIHKLYLVHFLPPSSKLRECKCENFFLAIFLENVGIFIRKCYLC